MIATGIRLKMVCVGRPIRFMLILVSFTMLYLVIMLDRWSEKTKTCQLAKSVCPHTSNIPHSNIGHNIPCICKDNSTYHRQPKNHIAVKRDIDHHVRYRQHINYYGGTSNVHLPQTTSSHNGAANYIQQHKTFYQSTKDLQTARLESRLIEIQKLLLKLERSDHNGVNGKEIKCAQVTVRDVIGLLNGTSPHPHVSSLGRDYHPASASNTQARDTSVAEAVCDEVYKGTVYGYPFFNKGFETVPCTNAKQLKHVISVVFNFINYPITYRSSIMEIVESLARVHPEVTILVAVSDRMFSDNILCRFAQVDIVPYSTREAVVWNRLIDQVKTPYTFIAKGMVAFNQDGRLERLVRAISTLNVGVAGGAVRMPDGLWSMACHQTTFTNYTLIYRAGYHYSKHECVFCHHISGPFVARTALLRSQRFDESLDGRVLFEDYLFNLGQNNTQMVICPDSMFYVQSDDRDRYRKSMWLPFARKWKINILTFVPRSVISFTCEELYIDCSFITGLAVPPCCLQLLAEQIKFIMNTCEKNHILCELQEGSLLGAVKLNKVLPWERDGDITFLSSNYTALKNLDSTFAIGGYRLIAGAHTRCCEEGRTAGGTFIVKGVGTPWTVEMYGQHRMESETAISQGQIPTRIFFHGAWLTVPRNPGLHIRNRYGFEVYRHAQHWISLGKHSGWELYNPGRFTKCPVPGKHHCLDQFEGDGNLQFEQLPP